MNVVYLQSNQLGVVVEDSTWQFCYLIVIYVPIKRYTANSRLYLTL